MRADRRPGDLRSGILQQLRDVVGQHLRQARPAVVQTGYTTRDRASFNGSWCCARWCPPAFRARARSGALILTGRAIAAGSRAGLPRAVSRTHSAVSVGGSPTSSARSANAAATRTGAATHTTRPAGPPAGTLSESGSRKGEHQRRGNKHRFPHGSSPSLGRGWPDESGQCAPERILLETGFRSLCGWRVTNLDSAVRRGAVDSCGRAGGDLTVPAAFATSAPTDPGTSDRSLTSRAALPSPNPRPVQPRTAPFGSLA